MIARMLATSATIAIGAAAIGGLFWAFLNTPESNVLTLVLSSLLVVVMLAAAALTVTLAVLLVMGEPVRAGAAIGARRFMWALLIAVPIALLILTVSRADAWIAQHSGEISAWLIARFGLADPTRLFQAISYISIWLRCVVFPLAGVAALSAVLRHGAAGFARLPWLRAAWHWRTLVISTLAFVILLVLPWRLANWSPPGLPATWVQPAAAAIRLGAAALLACLGLTIMLAAPAHRMILKDR
jgi:hypothetical protein